MMRSRSRLEIYLDLMNEVSDHSDLTSIGKELSLSLGDTKKHVGFLVSQGFVRTAEQEKSRAEYELTTKGFEAVEALRMLAEHGHPLLKHTLTARLDA
jgi:predicted transcriptional regulator